MKKVTVNMVSDVVCPWCIVGYKNLQKAIASLTDIDVEIEFHPFELNPAMPEEGQNLREHIMEKYGITAQQSADNRARLIAAGDALGFGFNFSDDSMMLNTFKAHQVVHFAAQHDKQEEMKLRLFSAYFTEGQNVSDSAVLVKLAKEVGLNGDDVEQILTGEQFADAVRQQETIWQQRGIQSVPTFVIGNQGIAGAHPPETLATFIQQAAQA